MYPKTFFERNKPEPRSGQCFVLMPFAERFDEVYDAIAEALEGPDLNFSCTRADELFGGGHIMEDVLRYIGEAEVIIADVTTKNPNVFYELGIAHMCKVVEKVLILTQDVDDIPFDVRHFRCIVYEQSLVGLRELQETLTATIREISSAAYRFSVKVQHQYRFPHRLLGPDRCFHDFEITEVWVARNAAKFCMKEHQYALGQPSEMVREKNHGIQCGEYVDLAGVPWRLVLEETREGTAHFRVVPKE